MQSTHRTTPRLCKVVAVSPQLLAIPKRGFGSMMMTTTFPYILSSSSSSSIAAEMAPLFRMLDRPLYPRVRRWAQQEPRHLAAAAAPRFDVRERNAAFELQGELPGLQREDVTIEFVDPHTLVIRGRVEREERSTNVKDGEEESAPVEAEGSSTNLNTNAEVQGKVKPTTATNAGEADADIDRNNTTQTEANDETGQYKYWISERAVGGFERHFKFPSDVNQEAVKASLKNGILSVVVPKIVKRQKKIVVEGGE